MTTPTTSPVIDSTLFAEIERNVTAALAEDVGAGDLTAQLIPASAQAQAKVISRQAAVICGAPWFESGLRRLDPACTIRWHAVDGASVSPDDIVCEIESSARALLTGERCGLNFLQTLSATATATRRFVDAIAGTRAQIVDTRKTIPGLRLAQKYAVRCGGGTNHRIGLYDGILIKENHIMAAGGVSPALIAAQKLALPGVFIQIEVETLVQLEEALQAGAKMVLLDNMSTETMRRAVEISGERAVLEASGGVTLESVRCVAETGVNRISVGSLTKDVSAVDLSLRHVVK